MKSSSKEILLSVAAENRSGSNQTKLQKVNHTRHKRKYSNNKNKEELVLISGVLKFAALEVFKTR